MVDFQGWMYRLISLETAREFAKLFGSHVMRRQNRTSVIFCHWETFNFDDSIMALAGLEDSLNVRDLVRGNGEFMRFIDLSLHQSRDRGLT